MPACQWSARAHGRAISVESVLRSDEIARKLPTADVPSFASEDGARNRGSVTTIAAAIALSIEYAPTVFVKVYSMPAIGRMNVHSSAHVGRRRISPMEETAECPDAVGDFAAMAIDRRGCLIVSGATRRSWMLAGPLTG
mgnify:CR=1 FL=1